MWMKSCTVLVIFCCVVFAHDEHRFKIGMKRTNCTYIETSNDILGPYFEEDAPYTESLLDPSINYTDIGAQKLFVEGFVYLIQKNETTGECFIEPYADAALDVWHADFYGAYDNEAPFFWRARRLINESGGYSYKTIYPGRYALRPIHVHLMVSYNKSGELGPETRGFVTQMYFQEDTTSSSVPADLRVSLQEIELDGEMVKYTTFDFYIDNIVDTGSTTGGGTTSQSGSSLDSKHITAAWILLLSVILVFVI